MIHRKHCSKLDTKIMLMPNNETALEEVAVDPEAPHYFGNTGLEDFDLGSYMRIVNKIAKDCMLDPLPNNYLRMMLQLRM